MNTHVATTPGQEIKFCLYLSLSGHKHFSDFYTSNFLSWNSYNTYVCVSKEFIIV